MGDIVDKDLALNNAHLRDCSLHAQYKILFLLHSTKYYFYFIQSE